MRYFAHAIAAAITALVLAGRANAQDITYNGLYDEIVCNANYGLLCAPDVCIQRKTVPEVDRIPACISLKLRKIYLTPANADKPQTPYGRYFDKPIDFTVVEAAPASIGKKLFIKLKYGNKNMLLQMNPVQNRIKLDFSLSYAISEVSVPESFGNTTFNRSILYGSCDVITRSAMPCAAMSQ